MSASSNETGHERGKAYWARTIAFWFFTVMIAWEMVAGSMWDLLRIDYVRGVMTHLGYPLYFLFIIGAWKLPCGAALLAPRFLRLKEWAYAGAFFNYSGASASHLLAGDGADKWVGPFVFALFTLASWALRPPERRLPSLPPATKTPLMAWVISAAAVALMLIGALVTLPKAQ